MSNSKKVVMLILWLVVPFIMLPILIYKRGKKLTAFVVCFFSIILYLSIIGSADNTENTIIADAKIIATSEPTEIITAIPTIMPTEIPTITAAPTTKLSVDISIAILKESFTNVATITYNENLKKISITPLDNGITMGVMLAKNGDKESLNKWEKIVTSLQEISGNIDGNIMLSVLNSLNTENSLLIIQNGIIFYNAAN
jgi:hypothetical protein